MSQENVEIVQAAIAAYLSNDEATTRELIAPDLVVSTRPDQPDAVDRRGYEGLLQASAEWVEAWDEHTLEVARVWGAGDLVVVSARESAHGKTRVSGVAGSCSGSSFSASASAGSLAFAFIWCLSVWLAKGGCERR
jgi:ketosteroid isomerase-like protein